MKLIDEQREDHSVVKLCSLLKTDPGSYYHHCRQNSFDPEQSDQLMVQAIRESYEQSRQIYGRSRIHKDLQKKGIRIGFNRLARLMKRRRYRRS